MNRWNTFGLSSAVLCLLCLAGNANGEQITFRFTGTLRSVSWSPPSGRPVSEFGTVVSGLVIFDSDSPPTHISIAPGIQDIRQYDNAIGLLSFKSDSSAEGVSMAGRIQIQDIISGTGSDIITFRSLSFASGPNIGGVPLQEIAFTLACSCIYAIPTAELPTTPYPLGSFHTAAADMRYYAPSLGGVAIYDLTSFTLVEGVTPTGSNVAVQPIAVDQFGNSIEDAPVSFSFDSVLSSGETTVTISNSGMPLPLTFKLGSPPTYYNLETTATFSGSIDVCIEYTGTTFASESNAKLLHFDGTAWINITTSLNTDTNVICGAISSLSPFIVAESASPQEMITGLMFQIMQLNLSKGIENSLDAKLESATAALSDAREGNDGAAINMIAAVINAVDGQRNVALNETEADALIASAEAIISALSGQ